MSTPRNLRGVCLAAGFGTRLKPLTDSRPKAAIPVANIPSLYFAFEKMSCAGIQDVGVNSHYHADKVKELVKSAPFPGISFTVSHEPEIMGSGGAYIGLKDWRGDSDVLVYNPDIISDLDINAFIDDFYREKKLVSIAVIDPRSDLKPSVHTQSSKVTHVGNSAPKSSLSHCGMGAFLLSNDFFKYLDLSGPSNLSTAINAAIDNHQNVGWFPHSGYWQDIGNGANSLFKTNSDLITNPTLFESLGCDPLLKKLGVNYQIVQEKESTRFVNDQVSLHPDSKYAGVNLFFDSLQNDNPCQFENCLLGNTPELSLSVVHRNKIVLGSDVLEFSL